MEFFAATGKLKNVFCQKKTFTVCGAVRFTAPQESPRTPATCIAATTPGLIFRILNSVFSK